MKKILSTSIILLSLLILNNSWASGENRSIKMCKDKIESIYSVDRFRHVEADKTGHHKYDVHGKVKYNGVKRPFSCRVRGDRIRSYHYDGPHKRHSHHDDESHTGRNVAIGVGIAAIAIAIAKNRHEDDDKDNNHDRYDRHITKEDLEDSCHDSISRRIKDNYHSIRRVTFKHDSITHNMRKSEGDGRVVYRDGSRTDLDFTCHFDRNGRVDDTSYSIY